MTSVHSLSAPPEAPEPGQLVRVRGRHWVVADVDAGGGLADFDGGDRHHLVTLTSVEDGRYDDTFQLLW